MTGGRRAALVDGSLAATVLAAVVAVGAVVDARPTPVAAVVGAAGAVLLEVLSTSHRERVRRTWRRPGAKAGSVLAGIALVLAVAVVAPDAGLSAVAGGLLAYLGVLIAVVATPTFGSTSR